MRIVALIVLYLVAFILLIWWTKPLIANLKKKLRFTIYCLLFISLVFIFFAFLEFMSMKKINIPQTVYIIGFISFAFYVHFFTIVIGFAILRGLVYFFKRDKRINGIKVRRLCLSMELVLAVFLCLYGVFCVSVSKLTKIDVNNVSNSHLNIIMVSDIHYAGNGSLVNLDKLQKEINDLNPDIVILAGDVIDNSISKINRVKFVATLGNIKSKYGVFAVIGNHELYYNRIEEIEHFYENSNITLLNDKEVIINNQVRIIGRIDAQLSLEGSRNSIENIASDSNLPLIVVDHRPDDFLDAYKANAQLLVSGHTHNGQIFPANIFVGLYYQIFKGGAPFNGLYNYKDFCVYVSKGYGSWGMPMRTTGRSEIVQINFYL